jgi:hypothetical protein
MKRVMLTDDPAPPQRRRRAVVDDDTDPVPVMPTLDTTPEIISRFKAPIDPFDLTHPIRVPADVARLASRFTHEAVAALRLEIHSKTGRARSHAATQLLALAMHAPDAAILQACETLSNEALDEQLAGLLKAEGTEELLAQFGYLKARTDRELRMVDAIVNRDRGTVA